jgi:hypothetical protein
MGFFGFIENFFFITLAITFVLILLLVYHFKERVSNTEQKMDKMFEIVNNIVKELGFVKNIAMRNMAESNPFGASSDLPEGITQKTPLFDNITYSMHESAVNQMEEVVDISDSVEECDPEEEEEEDYEEKTDGDEDEDYDEYEEEDEDLDLEKLTKKLDEELAKEETIIPVILEKEETIIPVILEKEPSVGGDKKEAIKESYRKMTLTQLKTCLIEKGYTEDMSKLKKTELIKLLESM